MARAYRSPKSGGMRVDGFSEHFMRSSEVLCAIFRRASEHLPKDRSTTFKPPSSMPRYASSTQLESLNALRIKKFKEWNLLKDGWRNGELRWRRMGNETGDTVGYDLDGPLERNRALHLKYRYKANYDADWQETDYRVAMEATPCHYGGQRWWFRCPVAGCGRRCAVLYKRGRYFSCRRCTGCWYDSQTWVNQRFRLLGKVWRIDEYRSKVKRRFYKGRPTKQYRRYTALASISERILDAEEALFETVLRRG